MDRSKLVLAMGIVAMMLAVCLSVPSDDVAGTDVSVDELAASWSYDSNDSFTVGSLDELKKFAQLVNGGKDFKGKTVSLTKDIDLGSSEWTPIGSGTRTGSSYTAESKAFRGVFDGCGYVISNLKITTPTGDQAAGLFGIVAEGTVRNVLLDGISINVGSDDAAGAVAGILCENGLIENCVSGLSSSGNSITANDGLGGIVGRMLISGTIKDCQNIATMTGKGKTGGIVGAAYYTETTGKMSIIGCTNYASVTTDGGYSGGVVGMSAAFVEDCVNTGTVTSKGSTGVGGIIGEQRNYGSVTDCDNFGNVKKEDTGYGAGGIVGYVRYDAGSAYNANDRIKVTGCYNEGSVLGNSSTSGGIVGMWYNYGEISGNTNRATTIDGTNFISGITNYQFEKDSKITTKELIISNNVSTTDVQASTSTGSCRAPIVYDNNILDESGEKAVKNDGTNKVVDSDAAIKKYAPSFVVLLRSQTPTISINASSDSPVVGDTVTLTASISNETKGITYTYGWSTGATSKIIEVTSGSNYVLTVTASDGIRSYSTTAEKQVAFGDKIETETDESTGTTTTVIEKEDGSKVTEVKDSKGTSVTTETTKVVEETEATTTTISTTTVVVKDNGSKVTSAEAKAEIKVEAKESAGGTVEVEVSETVVEEALKTIVVEDEEVEDAQVSKTLTVAADTTQISLTPEATKAISDSGAKLEFVSSEGTLTADANVVKTLASQDDKLTISFVKADDVVLPDTQQKVEDPTAYRLTVTKQDGTTVHKLKGTVDLTVKYDLPSNVAASEVLVIYVDDNGKMEAMATTYNPDTGILKFSTDHFSYFMVGTKSMMSTTPTIIPDDDDYDYIPPYVAPTNTDNNDDDSKKMLACAAAAVVAALMAAFLVIDKKR